MTTEEQQDEQDDTNEPYRPAFRLTVREINPNGAWQATVPMIDVLVEYETSIELQTWLAERMILNAKRKQEASAA